MSLDLALVSEEDMHLIDQVADLAVRADDGDLAAELQLHQLFIEEDRINPRGEVRTLSPSGSVTQVDLRTRHRRPLGE